MLENIRNLIKRIYNKITNKTDEEESKHRADTLAYEDASKPNITAIVANKLATLTVTESALNITLEDGGATKRTEQLHNIAQAMWDNAQEITARAFGTGGVLLLPYAVNGKIYTDIVPRDRFYITSSQGTDIKEATILSDVIIRQGVIYYRLTDFSLDNGSYVIRNRALRSNSPAPLGILPEWAGIEEEIRIANVDKMLFAYLRSPFNRGRTDNLYGIPITHGSGDIIRQIEECFEQVENEFKQKKVRIFADSSMFNKDDKLSDLYKKLEVSAAEGAKQFFEAFDPAFRETAYYTRLNALFELLEKSIGTSRGILTEPVTTGATATEIKRSTYDTFALITAMRRQWEKAAADLINAYDVLCNYYGLSPISDYKINFDWSYALIENSSEEWQQLKDGQSMGVIKKAEVRQWLTPTETLEEAQAIVDEITEKEPGLNTLMGLGE